MVVKLTDSPCNCIYMVHCSKCQFVQFQYYIISSLQSLTFFALVGLYLKKKIIIINLFSLLIIQIKHTFYFLFKEKEWIFLKTYLFTENNVFILGCSYNTARCTN